MPGHRSMHDVVGEPGQYEAAWRAETTSDRELLTQRTCPKRTVWQVSPGNVSQEWRRWRDLRVLHLARLHDPLNAARGGINSAHSTARINSTESTAPLRRANWQQQAHSAAEARPEAVSPAQGAVSKTRFRRRHPARHSLPASCRMKRGVGISAGPFGTRWRFTTVPHKLANVHCASAVVYNAHTATRSLRVPHVSRVAVVPAALGVNRIPLWEISVHLRWISARGSPLHQRAAKSTTPPATLALPCRVLRAADPMHRAGRKYSPRAGIPPANRFARRALRARAIDAATRGASEPRAEVSDCA